MKVGGFGNILKQAQQMQENLQKAQQELSNSEVTGESGGGMVKIVMTGRHDVRRVVIDQTLLDEGKGMLEDLIAAAINDANRRAEEVGREKMASMAAGLNLPPGLFNLSA